MGMQRDARTSRESRNAQNIAGGRRVKKDEEGIPSPSVSLVLRLVSSREGRNRGQIRAGLLRHLGGFAWAGPPSAHGGAWAPPSALTAARLSAHGARAECREPTKRKRSVLVDSSATAKRDRP